MRHCRYGERACARYQTSLAIDAQGTRPAAEGPFRRRFARALLLLAPTLFAMGVVDLASGDGADGVTFGLLGAGSLAALSAPLAGYDSKVVVLVGVMEIAVTASLIALTAWAVRGCC
jgi:hypothetical protein